MKFRRRSRVPVAIVVSLIAAVVGVSVGRDGRLPIAIPEADAHIAWVTNHLRPYAFRPNCGSARVAPINVIWYDDATTTKVSNALFDGDWYLDAAPLNLVRDNPPPPGQLENPPTNPINDYFATHFSSVQDPDGINCRVKSMVHTYFGGFVGYINFLTTRMGNTPEPPYTTYQVDIDPDTFGYGKYSISAARHGEVLASCIGPICNAPVCYRLDGGPSTDINGFSSGEEAIYTTMDEANYTVNELFFDNRLSIDLGNDCSPQNVVTPDGYVAYVRVP